MTSAPLDEGVAPASAPAEPRPFAPREASLDRYAPALVEEIDRDLAKWLKSRIKADPRARIDKLLSSHDLIRKTLAKAPEPLRRALTAFARLPGIELRHDHALALLEAVGAGSGRHAYAPLCVPAVGVVAVVLRCTFCAARRASCCAICLVVCSSVATSGRRERSMRASQRRGVVPFG